MVPKILIGVCFFICFTTNAISKTCLDCKMLYALFERQELKRYYHLDIHLNDAFKIIDTGKFFPSSCYEQIENREVIIVYEIGKDEKVTKRPLPLVFKIVTVKKQRRETIINFEYDYEGIVGKAVFDRRNIIEKIVVWER